MRQFLVAFCLLTSSFVICPSVSAPPALADDGGHGGGGDHGGNFGSRNNGFDAHQFDHQNGHDGRTHPIYGRLHDRDDFFDNFGPDDECYPEWAYDREEHFFRSDVCPD